MNCSFFLFGCKVFSCKCICACLSLVSLEGTLSMKSECVGPDTLCG